MHAVHYHVRKSSQLIPARPDAFVQCPHFENSAKVKQVNGEVWSLAMVPGDLPRGYHREEISRYPKYTLIKQMNNEKLTTNGNADE